MERNREQYNSVFSTRYASAEMQYLFSVYGEFQVGDDVAIVWEKSGNAENASYTAVDVVGDY